MYLKGTNAFKAYRIKISERHRHRYEFNNAYKGILTRLGMKISGTSPDGELVEIIEMENHPWFLGCQFHPEFKSRPRPHPLFGEFIGAALSEKRSLFPIPRAAPEIGKAKKKTLLTIKITMTREINIAGAKIGGNNPPLIMASPVL